MLEKLLLYNVYLVLFIPLLVLLIRKFGRIVAGLIIGLSIFVYTAIPLPQEKKVQCTSCIPATLSCRCGDNSLSNASQQNLPSVTPVPVRDRLVSKSSDSSVSNSKSDTVTSPIGNKLKTKFVPNNDPSGSGSNNNGSETSGWESKASCPNPDKIISDIDFWNYYLDSIQRCPNANIELDEDDNLNFEQIVEIQKSRKQSLLKLILSALNEASPMAALNEASPMVMSIERNSGVVMPLLAPTPTAKLDKAVKPQYTYSNAPLEPVEYYSREGLKLIIANKELEKVVYAHSDDIGIFNFADRIQCPVQNDPAKYQRSECRAVTDSSKREALIKILEFTTSPDSNYVTRKFPMPSFPSQDAIGYLEVNSNRCVMFHADSGKLWSATTFSDPVKEAILANPQYILVNPNDPFLNLN